VILNSEHLDADHDEDAPLKFKKMTNIIGPSTPHGFAERNVPEELFLAAEEPNTFSQAEKDASWKAAMTEEINSIEENNT
jgi:hypothetical protein